jgi:1-acyl-sn-glycerol-3-phosphate acyltransferase
MQAAFPRQSRFYQRIGLPVWRVLLWPLTVFWGAIRSSGRYRIPRKGGLLILANHISDADPPYLQLACPRATHFMAKSELFAIPVIAPCIERCGAFPVKQGEPDRGALRHAISLLEQGEAVAVFPEGEASETGELLPLKPGIAMIARQTGVPVICCGIRGTNRIIPYRALIPRPSFRCARFDWGEVRAFTKANTTEEILAWAEGQLRSLTDQER